jgi:hypothetical protein
VIGTVQVTHRRQGSHRGPADATIRSAIGGTDYQIDLSDRRRIPASIIQRCQSRHGKTVPAAWRIADPNQSPGGQSTPRGREGRPRPHISVTSAACMVMRSTAYTVFVSRSGCSSGIRDLSCIATGQIADMVRVC